MYKNLSSEEINVIDLEVEENRRMVKLFFKKLTDNSKCKRILKLTALSLMINQPLIQGSPAIGMSVLLISNIDIISNIISNIRDNSEKSRLLVKKICPQLIKFLLKRPFVVAMVLDSFVF